MQSIRNLKTPLRILIEASCFARAVGTFSEWQFSAVSWRTVCGAACVRASAMQSIKCVGANGLGKIHRKHSPNPFVAARIMAESRRIMADSSWQCAKTRGFCMVPGRSKPGRILAFWRTLAWQPVKSTGNLQYFMPFWSGGCVREFWRSRSSAGCKTWQGAGTVWTKAYNPPLRQVEG